MDESDVDDIREPRVPLHPDPELVDLNLKKYKFGIIYFSYIPEGLNVKILKEIMSEFGEVGRVYLEPEKNNKKHRTYIEGWLEFKKKRIAKHVAKILNGTPIQYGRKRCKINGQIWSIEYLHKFKWADLTDQLAHDRASKEQRRVFELAQAKKHVNFYEKMLENSKRMRKINQPTESTFVQDKLKLIGKRQNKSKVRGRELEVSVDDDLLSNIFKPVS